LANDEYLAILRKGVEEWNRWREENPDEQPDLGGANLSASILFYDPNLSHAEVNDLIYKVFELKTTSPIVLHHVFISYSHVDSEFVEKLETGLDDRHIRYWRDVHDLKAGRLEKQIEKAIRVNPLVLLVLSEHSVESDWVEWEVSKARELEQEKRPLPHRPRRRLGDLRLAGAASATGDGLQHPRLLGSRGI